jgi:hypothetical protein
MRQVHFQDTTALGHPLVVVLDSEKAESSPPIIPVPSDALDASGAIVEGMGQNSDFGFG